METDGAARKATEAITILPWEVGDGGDSVLLPLDPVFNVHKLQC